jgi:hypothetical protein
MRAIVVALGLAAALPSEAALVTVHSDVARLTAAASGCADLLASTQPNRPSGERVCSALRDEAVGAVFGGVAFGAEAGPADGAFPWHARAAFGSEGGGYGLLLVARTDSPSSPAACQSRPCDVETASAVASVLWRAEFSVEGGDVAFRIADSPYTALPWTLRLQDLTTGATFDGPPTGSLASGRRYALEFAMTQVGAACVRTCASELTFLFPGASFVAATTSVRSTVPEPTTAGLLGIGLAMLLASRAAESRRGPRSGACRSRTAAATGTRIRDATSRRCA